jgi:hypothetical protein
MSGLPQFYFYKGSASRYYACMRILILAIAYEDFEDIVTSIRDVFDLVFNDCMGWSSHTPIKIP